MEQQALEYSEVQTNHMDQEVSRRETKRNKNKIVWTVVTSLLMVGIWVGIMYIFYLQANSYMTTMKEEINTEIQQVKIYNLKELDDIKVEMNKLHVEMESIKDELASTGRAVDGTDKTGQALQEQITSLNQQLSGLKNSLTKLEDAARAW